jgi:hypothetical protein
MALEQAKRSSEKVTGVSNVVYDALAMLTETLEGAAIIEQYKLDAKDAGDQEALQLFDSIQRQETEQIAKLKQFVRQRLQ